MIIGYLTRFSLVNKLLDKAKPKDQELIQIAERAVGDLPSLLVGCARESMHNRLVGEGLICLCVYIGVCVCVYV
jgi:hypothetical protein